jgi:FkbM family methyltransferase
MDIAVRFVRPGDVIWDVGANCGVFATASAGLAGSKGSVLAIEPDTTTAKVLHMNAVDSPGTDRAAIDVLECAVSDSIGTAALSIANRGRSTNYLSSLGGRSDTGGSRSTRRVVTVTLDWLAQQFQMPSLMKIDVEGAEAMVIRGGMRVLRDAQPVILCEVGDDTRMEVCGALSSLGYTLSDAEDPAREDGWRLAHNVLAIPPAARLPAPTGPA